MAEIDHNKFIVIPDKRLDELTDRTGTGCGCRSVGECGHWLHTPIEIKELESAISNFKKAYERRVGTYPHHKYWVCNQDEPYANKIIEIILKGEDEKASNKSINET